MSLGFLPRKLQQRVSKRPVTTLSENGTRWEKDKIQVIPSDVKGKRKAIPEVISDETILILLKLAFSDYTLYKEEAFIELLEERDGNEYIPLDQILSHSSYLSSLITTGQARLVQLMRSNFPHIEIRLRISEISTSRIEDAGGFEIRCCDWRGAVNDRWTEAFWEERTVYIENVPHEYRTIPSIFSFLQSIAPDGWDLGIQSITFPSHHSDRHGDVPRYKGFAFVVFSDTKKARGFSLLWPWESSAASKTVVTDRVYQEARLIGFRCLSYSQWTKLRDEYLVYQAELTESAREAQQVLAESPSTCTIEDAMESIHNGETEWYPRGCLVFIKNIHSDTNKTTVRKLLQDVGDIACIDYLDYQKGVDTCLVRCQTGEDARKLWVSVGEHTIYQIHGLDEAGSSTNKDDRPPLIAELLSGAREELYWEKIPSKIREQCLGRQHALSVKNGSHALGHPGPEISNDISANMKGEDDWWFPRGCLVFAKGIHPETNKTTLRKFFGRAFPGENGEDQIDYVEYHRGVDSCHIRLCTASASSILNAYFSGHHFQQREPLDDTGVATSGTKGPSVKIEVVCGKKEELYWKKIPEKVRKAALERAQGKDAQSGPLKKRRRRDGGGCKPP